MIKRGWKKKPRTSHTGSASTQKEKQLTDWNSCHLWIVPNSNICLLGNFNRYLGPEQGWVSTTALHNPDDLALACSTALLWWHRALQVAHDISQLGWRTRPQPQSAATKTQKTGTINVLFLHTSTSFFFGRGWFKDMWLVACSHRGNRTACCELSVTWRLDGELWKTTSVCPDAWTRHLLLVCDHSLEPADIGGFPSQDASQEQKREGNVDA